MTGLPELPTDDPSSGALQAGLKNILPAQQKCAMWWWLEICSSLNICEVQGSENRLVCASGKGDQMPGEEARQKSMHHIKAAVGGELCRNQFPIRLLH